MIDDRRALATTCLVLGDLAVLLGLRPDAGALAGELAALHAWVAAAGTDAAALTLAGAALWCLALWLGVGLLAAASAALPGNVGRLARSSSRVLLPGAIHRLLAGTAGLGVLLAPVAVAAAAPVPSSGGSPPATATSVPAIPAPSWPLDPPQAHPPRAHPLRAHPPSRGATLVMRPGDCLWRIAADHLGERATPARIAATWPRWYTANRTVIGPDARLIRPGQILHLPTSPEGPQ